MVKMSVKREMDEVTEKLTQQWNNNKAKAPLFQINRQIPPEIVEYESEVMSQQMSYDSSVRVKKQSRIKNEDYFKYEEDIDMIKTFMKKEFSSEEELKTQALDQLNKNHRGVFLFILKRTAKYYCIKCARCKNFRVRFSYSLSQTN